MLEWIALAVALLSAGLVLAERGRLSAMAQRIQVLEAEIARLRVLPEPEVVQTTLGNGVLEGVRIAIRIDQDHKLPLVAEALKERLQDDDAVVRFLEGGEATEGEVTIEGRVRCNGYSDVYYEADLLLRMPNGEVLSFAETPPSGARQVNLASRVVDRLRNALVNGRLREERQKALSELNEY